ncbi:MAG TPA: 3'(2'),5'-bisphosphate nucleotidase CysQ [Bacteroidales bacterium]|nr:3'(2'),5'-bisphosphate nucleotidase CysQ [Bacteroidales bacterium]
MSELLSTSIHAAIDAGLKIMEVFNDRIRVRIKRNFTPVTNADKAANQIIIERLLPFKIPVISEESVISPYKERMAWDVFWLVDPLDGTREFISRSNDFTVNIALVRDHIPLLGVIYAPAYDILYFAEDKLGSFKLEAASKLINTSRENGIDKIVSESRCLPYTETETYTYLVSKSHINAKTRKYLKNDKKPKHFLSKGSSLKLCMLAEGSADEYPRFGRTMEWDTAAGDAILRYAGGKIRNVENSKPLKYNKENLANPEFIAYHSSNLSSL